MDVVYILGSGSLVNNEEIRYSIRSLVENMIDMRNLYIIGEKPHFIQNVQHHFLPDSDKKSWKNVYNKIMFACEIPELSDEFLLMNDDFFLLEPFQGVCFPYYSLKGIDGGTCGRYSFQVHCPFKIYKEWFKKLPIDLSTKGNLSLRSFYANFTNQTPIPTTDPIIRTGNDYLKIDEQLIGRDFFSISDSDMLDPVFVNWLSERYPKKSRFEL